MRGAVVRFSGLDLDFEGETGVFSCGVGESGRAGEIGKRWCLDSRSSWLPGTTFFVLGK
jgi:hypothetical protein